MNKENKSVQRMTVFTIVYIVFFLVYAWFLDNYEFIFYSALMLFMLLLLAWLYRRFQMADWIFISLSAFGLLHLLGGNVMFDGVPLYQIHYFGGRIGFDNIVHTLGIFLMTIILYNAIHPFLDQRIKENYLMFYLVLILMALGAGTLNEIVELTAVVFLGAGASVGDYYNNAVDLVFNLIGALLAVIVIHRSTHKRVNLQLTPRE